jgi:hypothetical protein
MSKSLINVGAFANDATGDSLRVAGQKINDNFTEIYDVLGNGSSLSGIVTFAQGAYYSEISGISTYSEGLIDSPQIAVDGVTCAGIVTMANSSIVGTAATFTATGVTTVSAALQAFHKVDYNSNNTQILISDFKPGSTFEVICRNTDGSTRSVLILTSETDTGHALLPLCGSLFSGTITNGVINVGSNRMLRVRIWNENGSVYGMYC